MARAGDAFSGRVNLGRGIGERPAADRFDRGLKPAAGIYPRKGKGWGQQGESTFPDLLRHYNQNQRWTSWRRGLEIAFNSLVDDTSQYQAVEVLRLPAFSPQDGFRATRAVLVGFPSRSSPEGRWTVAVNPRGSEIAPVPISATSQSHVTATTDDGEPVPLLVVQLPGCWQPGALAAGSALIGELVEDSAISASELADDPADGIAMLCVAVYQDDGLMVFDASRYWQRRRRADNTLVLEEVVIGRGDPQPQFRVSRHLTQSTVVSCNCPSHLGVEYGRLRDDVAPGGQGLFPQRGGEGASSVELPLRDALDAIVRQAPEQRPADPLEGAARRFALLDWRRLPQECCKHCHAVRFSLGCPVSEPADVPAVIGGASEMGIGSLLPLEERSAPLAAPRFVEQLRRQVFDENAWRGLASTITTGAVGDAWSVTPETVALPPNQIDGTFPENCAPRFSQQQLLPDPTAAEGSLRGDVWAGRLSQQYSFPYEAPGQLLEQPFYLPTRDVIALLP